LDEGVFLVTLTPIEELAAKSSTEEGRVLDESFERVGANKTRLKTKSSMRFIGAVSRATSMDIITTLYNSRAGRGRSELKLSRNEIVKASE
jgi:hypothetical protein